MSFEGRLQIICKGGHYCVRDAFMDETEFRCSVCQSKVGWSNLVDDTNGDACGYIPEEVLEKNFLLVAEKHEVCNLGHKHVLTRRVFSVPKRSTENLRTYQPDGGERILTSEWPKGYKK